MPASRSLSKDQEKTVVECARLLGTTTSSLARTAVRPRELALLFSEAVTDHDVVLTLPSLDCRVGIENDQVGNPLPDVGEPGPRVPEHSSGEASTDAVENVPNKPLMAASVLVKAVDDASILEHQAEKHLGKLTSWTKSTLVYAPEAMATNVSDSFSFLMDSRLRSWTLLLLRHSLSTGDSESRTRLLRILSANVAVDAAETTLQTLPMPDSAACHPKEADVILPLLFETKISLTLQGKQETVVLRAPGTMSAYFGNNSITDIEDLQKVDVRLDTDIMLKAMVDQARLIIFKTVANATHTPLPLGVVSKAPGSPKDVVSKGTRTEPASEGSNPSILTSTSLAGFRSALNLGSSTTSQYEDQTMRLQKARSSALRLNGVLHGKKAEPTRPPQPQRVRSVKWDTPATLPKLNSSLDPSPKKARLSQAATVSKLKSFRSFGRPHAGDFGSGPRNATFGEYGGRQGMWGRDGRMIHHPTPMQEGGAGGFVEVPVPEKNATFNLNSAMKTSQSAVGVEAGMPRTATALENWFLKSAT
jgi:hypothetical protein